VCNLDKHSSFFLTNLIAEKFFDNGHSVNVMRLSSSLVSLLQNKLERLLLNFLKVSLILASRQELTQVETLYSAHSFGYATYLAHIRLSC
jgi:hypothetical protein